MSGTNLPTQTLIYDAECRMCVTAKAGIERLATDGTDPKVRFVPYQSEEAERHLGADYRPGRPDVAFLVEPDGRIRRGADAFLSLLPGFRGGRFLARVLRFPLFRPLADVVYHLIARYRYRLFGQVKCAPCNPGQQK